MKYKLSGTTKIPKKKAATFGFKEFSSKDLDEVVDYVNTHSVVPCKLKGGHRRKVNVEEIYPWFRLDVDQEGEAEVIDAALKQADILHIKKPSTSHDKYPYKWHYLIPVKNISQDYNSYKLQYENFLNELGIDLKDQSLKSVVQNMNPYGVAGNSHTAVEGGTVWKAKKITKSKRRSGQSVNKKTHTDISKKELKATLKNIDPSCSYEDWLKVGMAIFDWDNGEAGFKLFDKWSSKSESYDGSTVDKWDDFSAGNLSGDVTVGTIMYLAHGPKLEIPEEENAHDIKIVKPPEKSDSNEQEEAELTNHIMQEFEKQYKFIVHGGKIIFLHEYSDYKGQFCQVQKSPNSVKTEWADRVIRITTVQEGAESAESSVKLHKINVVDVAINGLELGEVEYPPMKRWQGFTFEPGREGNTGDTYNFFKGFDIKPKKGSIKPFIKIFNKVFGEKETQVGLDWFASMLQHPGKKILWAFVTRGGKGSGKNTFEEMLGKGLLRGENYFRTSQKEQLFGKFNAHLGSNLLTVGQEIVWGGSHDDDSVIKEMITESSRTLEAKGKDAIQVPNFSRLYLTSNADWVVPAAGRDERRFYVVDTSNGIKLKDWKALYRWYYKEGGQEALMYEMANRDLSDFEWIKAPMSKGLEEQLKQSLRGVELFIHNVIEGGYFERSQYNEMLTAKKNVTAWGTRELYEAYMRHNPKDKMSIAMFSRHFQNLTNATKSQFTSKRIKGFRMKGRYITALHFKDVTGVMPLVEAKAPWDEY